MSDSTCLHACVRTGEGKVLPGKLMRRVLSVVCSLRSKVAFTDDFSVFSKNCANEAVVHKILDRVLSRYDVRLRPNFGGKTCPDTRGLCVR